MLSQRFVVYSGNENNKDYISDLQQQSPMELMDGEINNLSQSLYFINTTKNILIH